MYGWVCGVLLLLFYYFLFQWNPLWGSSWTNTTLWGLLLPCVKRPHKGVSVSPQLLCALLTPPLLHCSNSLPLVEGALALSFFLTEGAFIFSIFVSILGSFNLSNKVATKRRISRPNVPSPTLTSACSYTRIWAVSANHQPYVYGRSRSPFIFSVISLECTLTFSCRR